MPFSRFIDLVTGLPGSSRLRSAAVNMGQSVVLTSLAISGLIVGLRAIGIFERPELALYDQFIRLQGDRPPDDRMLIVGVDEFDLQSLQEWPLSDGSLARLLKSLQAHQPRVIGIDILRDIPTGEGRDALIEQLQQANVITVCKVNSTDTPGVPPPAELTRESVMFSDLVVDSGGILRRSLLFLDPPPALPSAPTHACNTPGTLASLSFGSALNYLHAEGISVSFNENQHLQIGSTLLPPLTTNFGSYRGVDARGYQVMLRYRAEENSVPIVSLMDVIEGRVADDLIRDRIVLIGYTTPLAKDDFYTPYSGGRSDQQKMPGVVVHAQATSQILSVVLDGRSLITPWPFPLESIWIYGWSLAIGMIAWYARHPAWFVSGVLLISGAAYGLALLLFLQSVWIPIFPALVSVLMTAGGVVLVDRFRNSDYGKRVVKHVRTFLKIDIDQEKLNEQVAEITETDYFRDLKNTVQSLRSQPPTGHHPSFPSKSNVNIASNSKLFGVPQDVEDHAPNAEDRPTRDDTQSGHLQTPSDSTLENESEERTEFQEKLEPEEKTDDDGLDFLADLNTEAQKLKQNSGET